MLRDHDKDREPISIHALREEGDENCAVLRCPTHRFYPRPPRGGRPLFLTVSVALGIFLSTPSARRATKLGQRLAHRLCISIHALREEGDLRQAVWRCPSGLFLSTPSARRATFGQFRESGRWDISIHALREEGDQCPLLQKQGVHHFYPRPPRGGRHLLGNIGVNALVFLSTPSARRATTVPFGRHRSGCISIHALREEGDNGGGVLPRLHLYFYPRPPRGGRL